MAFWQSLPYREGEPPRTSLLAGAALFCCKATYPRSFARDEKALLGTHAGSNAHVTYLFNVESVPEGTEQSNRRVDTPQGFEGGLLPRLPRLRRNDLVFYQA